MNNWDDFRFFLALCRNNTLKLAARELKTDQATVGRRIYALEEKLKTKLFEKRSEGFFLTVFGERIRAGIEDIESSFQTIDRKIAGNDERMEGVIRVAMPGALANHLVLPNLKSFTNEFPDVEVQFLTGAEVLNLAKRDADLAFRFVRPSQQDLIVKRVGEVRLSLYGSKLLLKKHGPIEKLEDLQEVPFVGLFDRATSQTERLLRTQIQPHFKSQVLTSSAWSSVYSALSNHIGFGILPQFVARRNSELEEVSIAPSKKTTLWFVIHPEVQKNKRFSVFAEFLISMLRKNLEV
ncbi:MAG: LysR family transcriptional regulator [Deltaproteobacteria bacterium]|jgi:DNA-binding transcriptional LysR family regulator|nr:LysR family transcriptional regulator [Deltaproteobacteria bacterium]